MGAHVMGVLCYLMDEDPDNAEPFHLTYVQIQNVTTQMLASGMAYEMPVNLPLEANNGALFVRERSEPWVDFHRMTVAKGAPFDVKAATNSMRGALRQRDKKRPGFPVHKIRDSSGWQVLPDEITSALELARPADTPFWDAWIEFLRVAAEHGGFIVG